MDVKELHEEIHKLSRYKKILKKTFEKTLNDVEDMKTCLDDDKILEISNYEKKNTETILKSNPSILVCGQLNCGKSSFLNELLGGSKNGGVLPTNDTPCTARLVKLYYSETNVVQLRDGDGSTRQHPTYFKDFKEVRKSLKDKVALGDSQRRNINEINQVVEIGIDNELLKCGLQFIDAPGLSESDDLTKIVVQNLDSRMQLMLYLFDGNKQFNLEDQAFILRIKSCLPDIQVLFICNKVEEDDECLKMDCPDNQDLDEFAKGIHERNKSILAYKKLQTANLVDINVKDYKKSEEFFGISCWKIQHARRNNLINEFVDQYNRLLKRIAEKYSSFFACSLLTVAIRLNTFQRRVFDFCLNDKVLIEIKAVGSQQFTKKINELRKNVCVNPECDLHFIADMKKSFSDVFLKSFDKLEKNLRAELDLISIPENAGIESLEKFRKLILDMVLVRAFDVWRTPLLQPVNDAINWLKSTVDKLIKAASPFDDFVRKRVCLDGLVNLTRDDIRQGLGVELTELGQKCKNKFRLEEFKSKFVMIKTDDEWKFETARSMLESLDKEIIAEKLVEKIKCTINVALNEFYVLLDIIGAHYSQRVAKRNKDIILLEKKFPELGYRICVTVALISTLEHNTITLGPQLAKGSRGVIYDGKWKGISPSWHPEEQYIYKVWKKTTSKYLLGKCWNFKRFLPSSRFVSSVKALAYDTQHRMVWIIPKLSCGTLFNLLTGSVDFKKKALSVRLEIIIDLLLVAQFSAENNFHFSDYSPSNIFTYIDENGKYCVKFNDMKPESLTAPYPAPDLKLPFHFAPEIYKYGFQCADSCVTYSIAVQMIFVTIGEFIRVSSADREDFTCIKVAAVKYAIADDLTKLLEGSIADMTEYPKRIYQRINSLAAHCLCQCDQRFSIKLMSDDLHNIISLVKHTEREHLT